MPLLRIGDRLIDAIELFRLESCFPGIEVVAITLKSILTQFNWEQIQYLAERLFSEKSDRIGHGALYLVELR